MKRKFFLISLLILQSATYAQTKSNLDIFYELINKSTQKADSLLKSNTSEVLLRLSIPVLLDQMKPQVIKSLSNHNYKLKTVGNQSDIILDYTLTNAKVDYKNTFNDGIFGGTFVERETTLSGSFILSAEDRIGEPVNFFLSHTDTVALDDIASIENPVLPFTQGQMPSPPLFENLIQPALVVVTLLVTVILLFTVRSK